MSTEQQPKGIIANLSFEESRLGSLIEERENLYDLVGTGEINPFDSKKAAIKVGEAKEIIKVSIERRKKKRRDTLRKIEVYSTAEENLGKLEKEEKELEQIRAYDEHLSPDILKHHEKGFSDLQVDLREDSEISKAMDDLIFEEESSKREYILPTGKVARGDGAQLLNIASLGSKDNPIPRKVFLNTIYTDLDEESAGSNLSNALSRVKGMLLDTGLKLEHIRETDKERGKFSYYLIREDMLGVPVYEDKKSDKVEPRKPEESRAVLKMINYLHGASPSDTISFNDIREQFDGLSDPEINLILDLSCRELVKSDKRLEKIKQKSDRKDVGYYVEEIRKPKIKLVLHGDTLQHEGDEVELTEKESKFISTLKGSGSNVFYGHIRKKYFDPTAIKDDIDEFVEVVDEKITSLTEVDNIITRGGNKEDGYWVKLKDTSIQYIPGPISEGRLTAARMSFSGTSGKEEIIDQLGETKSGRPFNSSQAWISVESTYKILLKRKREGVITNGEISTLEEITDYINENKINIEQFLRKRFDIKQK
jgi:hypothetical protein